MPLISTTTRITLTTREKRLGLRFILFLPALALMGWVHPASAQTDSLNVLTATQSAEGWKLLWDGKSQKGFHTYLKGSMTDPWKIEDQSFSNPGSYKDACAEGNYGDFELSFDWKLNRASNSGVFYRVSETLPEPWHSGPEYGILDNKDAEDASRGPLFHSGANYGLQPPTKTGHPDSAVIDISKPIGQYNSSRIRILGDSVEHWLNDKRVVAYRFHSALWDKQRSISKFSPSEKPRYGQEKTGKLCFQDHGGGLRVWFRNIKVRPLTGNSFPTPVVFKQLQNQQAGSADKWVSQKLTYPILVYRAKQKYHTALTGSVLTINQAIDLQGRRKDWEVIELGDPRP